MREYGQDVKVAYLETISNLKNTVYEGKYSEGVGCASGSDLQDFYDECYQIINSTNTSISDMKAKLDTLKVVLCRFYDDTDRRLVNVNNRAIRILDDIKIINEAIENLVCAVRGVGIFEGTDVNNATIDIAMKPTKALELKHLVKEMYGHVDEKFSEYKKFLESVGVKNPTKEKLEGYLVVYGSLVAMGVSDKDIFDLTPALFETSGITNIVHIPSADQKALADSMLRSSVAKVLLNDFDSRVDPKEIRDYKAAMQYADSYFSVLTKNLSYDDLIVTLRSFTRPEVAFEGMDYDAELEFMVRFAIAGAGYRGEGDNSFFGANYYKDGKYGVKWCAMYVAWCMSSAGFFDGDKLLTGFTRENACDGYHLLAGVGQTVDKFRDKFTSFEDDKDYKPCIGDLIICHGGSYEQAIGMMDYGHIGIVAGYDEEKNIVYTIEGNNDQAVLFGAYNLDQEKDRPYAHDVQGFIRLGNRTGMDLIPNRLDDSNFNSFPWNNFVVTNSEEHGYRADEYFYVNRDEVYNNFVPGPEIPEAVEETETDGAS